MQLEKLSLAHKDLLSVRLKNVRSSLSEYSFANLYLFREVHDYHVLRDGGDVFIAGKTYDGKRYLMPTAIIGLNDVLRLIGLLGSYDFIFPVPQDWLGLLEGNGFSADFDEGDSDYVYTLEKLSTYKGPKLHGKKNLLNQFLSLYAPQALPLTNDRMPDALRILDVWQEDVGREKSATDYFSCREACERYDELVLCGGIYYVEGEPAGFVIGEEVTESMFTLHFAKGKRKFKGLYQYMYNHFANILPKKYAYLNFEQDMGKLALKIVKSSYYPDQMLRKYRVKKGLGI